MSMLIWLCFILEISSGCPWPSIALLVQNRGLKHHSIFYPTNTVTTKTLYILFLSITVMESFPRLYNEHPCQSVLPATGSPLAQITSLSLSNTILDPFLADNGPPTSRKSVLFWGSSGHVNQLHLISRHLHLFPVPGQVLTANEAEGFC